MPALEYISKLAVTKLFPIILSTYNMLRICEPEVMSLQCITRQGTVNSRMCLGVKRLWTDIKPEEVATAGEVAL